MTTFKELKQSTEIKHLTTPRQENVPDGYFTVMVWPSSEFVKECLFKGSPIGPDRSNAQLVGWIEREPRSGILLAYKGNTLTNGIEVLNLEGDDFSKRDSTNENTGSFSEAYALMF